VPLPEVPDLPLHSGFAAGWTAFGPLLDHHEVVVVDAANVIGSKPDGWWRDRAGAVRRLVAGLSDVATSGVPTLAGLLPALPGRSRAWPEWLVVREGAARAGSLPDGPVGVVDAPGSGDDEIVRQADEQRRRGHDVTVVTADRALRQRVEQLGARVAGPRTLTRLLAGQDSDSTD
jgi:hypothetical protein